MGISIQEELWNIFTYYSLHGNPRDPSRINATQFYNFCRDAMLFDPSMTDSAMTQAQVQLTFTAQCRQIKSAGSQSLAQTGRLRYDEFLTCLLGLALKCYPACRDSQTAMQQLLMDNILPLASRRKAAKDCPVAVEMAQCKAEMADLREHYGPPLLQLFHYFAVETKSSEHFESKAAIPGKINSFDDLASSPSPTKKTLQGSPGKKSKPEITYSDFLKYANELGVAPTTGLTTIDLGDIYLTTVATKNAAGGTFTTHFNGLTFSDVWDTLCRCAYWGYKEHTGLSLTRKMKGMFNGIWRHMQTSQTGKVTTESASHPKYRRRLRCFQLLNERFIALWTKDGFTDYLNGDAKAAGEISNIGKIMRGVKEGDIGATDAPEPEGAEEPDAEAEDEGAYKPVPNVRVELEIDDDQDFGDPRITPVAVTRLLRSRPELALLLKECMLEEGIGE